jgi:hypothetical protein
MMANDFQRKHQGHQGVLLFLLVDPLGTPVLG